MNWGLRLYSVDEIAKIVNTKTNPNEVLSLIKFAKEQYINLYKIISENPNEFNRIKANMESLYRVSRLKAKKLGVNVSGIPPFLKLEDFLKKKKNKTKSKEKKTNESK